MEQEGAAATLLPRGAWFSGFLLWGCHAQWLHIHIGAWGNVCLYPHQSGREDKRDDGNQVPKSDPTPRQKEKEKKPPQPKAVPGRAVSRPAMDEHPRPTGADGSFVFHTL